MKTKLSNPKDLLRYEQAAEEFNIPINTLYAKVSRNQIPHYRLGGRFIRFSRSELLAFILAHHVEAEKSGDPVASIGIEGVAHE